MAAPRDPVDLDLERRQVHDAVVAGEHARQARLELVRLHGGEKADAAEVHADDGDRRSEETLQRAQHRPVAAEHDGDVGAREILLRLADAVLLDLLVREQQFDARLSRDLLETLESRARSSPACRA